MHFGSSVHNFSGICISLVAIQMNVQFLDFSADKHGLRCFDINFYATSKSYNWQLGHCHFSDQYAGGVLGFPKGDVTIQIFTSKCCVPDGDHIFSCKNDNGNGWAHGVVKIGKHQFCDDIIGYNKFITINIPGRIEKYSNKHIYFYYKFH